jgi:hypothetical protein
MLTPYYLLEFSQLNLVYIGEHTNVNSILPAGFHYEFGSFKPSTNSDLETIRLQNNDPPRYRHQNKLFTVDPESTIITINYRPVWWDILEPVVKIRSSMPAGSPFPERRVEFVAECDGQNHTKYINYWDPGSPNPSQRLDFYYKCHKITKKITSLLSVEKELTTATNL